jgi:hypothetical protein
LSGGNNTIGFSNVFIGREAGLNNTYGGGNTLIGDQADVGNINQIFGSTAIGAGSIVLASNTIALGRANGGDTVQIYGLLDLVRLGTGGITELCRNGSDKIATCSSSLRYKTDVQPFFGGLNIVRQLRPIAFSWKDGGLPDVGFGAEEVEKIEPLLTTRNDKGEIEGVKYAQISTVLVNAVNEQQQIIERQQRQIDALKKIVCRLSPASDICAEKEEIK